MGTGSFPGVKRLGCGTDHPLPATAEFKERVELYFYSPFEALWPVLGWALLYFTFTVLLWIETSLKSTLVWILVNLELYKAVRRGYTIAIINFLKHWPTTNLVTHKILTLFKSSLHYWQSNAFYILWKFIYRKLWCLPFESHNTAYFLPARNQISNDPIRCDLWGKGRNPTHGTIIFIGPYTGIAEEVTTHVVIHRISGYFLATVMKIHYVIFCHSQCKGIPHNRLLSLYCTVSLSFILQVWN